MKCIVMQNLGWNMCRLHYILYLYICKDLGSFHACFSIVSRTSPHWTDVFIVINFHAVVTTSKGKIGIKCVLSVPKACRTNMPWGEHNYRWDKYQTLLKSKSTKLVSIYIIHQNHCFNILGATSPVLDINLIKLMAYLVYYTQFVKHTTCYIMLHQLIWYFCPLCMNSI